MSYFSLKRGSEICLTIVLPEVINKNRNLKVILDSVRVKNYMRTVLFEVQVLALFLALKKKSAAQRLRGIACFIS